MFKKQIKQLLLLITSLSLFMLPLINAWAGYWLGIENSNTVYSALTGLIPYSDAAGYYASAHELLTQGFLGEWNLRRPLNAILFAARLFVADNDFKIASIIQALACGLSCLLVIFSVKRHFGIIATALSFFILFVFASVFIPTTMSETLGLTIGCLAFVLLWEGVQTKNLGLLFSAGLVLLVGLNARAGAFFMPPLMMIWLGLEFKDHQYPHFHWPRAMAFGLGLLTAFVFNLLLIKISSGTGTISAPHANFAHTVFGLVSGGKGWSYIYTVYPQFSGSEAEFAKFVYHQSWQTFKHNPFLLLVGFANSLAGLLKALMSFFQYDLPNSLLLKIIIRAFGFMILCVLITQYYKTYKESLNPTLKNKNILIKLVAVGLLGSVLSAAIIWTDGGFRVFAVSVPFFAVALGISISALFQKAMPSEKQKDSTENTDLNIKTALVFSYSLIIIGILMPLWAQKHFAAQSTGEYSLMTFHCKPSEQKILVKNIAGAPSIKLYPATQTNTLQKTFASPWIDSPIKKDYLNILESPPFKETVIGLIYDRLQKRLMTIAGPRVAFLNHQSSTVFCLAPAIHKDQQIFFVQSFEVYHEP